MKKRIYYYKDEVNDDFFGNGDAVKKKLPDNYKYVHKNLIWRFLSFFFHYICFFPTTGLYYMLHFRVRIKNRKVLRKIKTGYFLYGNHAQEFGDAIAPTFMTFPKKPYIIVNPDIVVVPVGGILSRFAGALPLPNDVGGLIGLVRGMEVLIKKKNPIVIYPEAHVWPFYNGIRPFKDTAFTYPFKFNVPAVGFAVTFRKRKIFKNGKPLVTITLSQPVYPKDCENKKEMRDKIYNFMCKTVKDENSYGVFEYIKSNEKKIVIQKEKK